MIVLFTSLAVFLCSRFRLGSLIIFGIGTFIFAAIEFLYTPHLYVAFFIYLIASATFIALKYYKYNDEAKPRGVITTVISALIFCLVAALLSSGIYFGIIKPNAPPPHELKLITVKMALPVIKKTGIADSFEQENKKKLTSENDNIEDSSKDNSKEDNKTKKDINNDQKQSEKSLDENTPSILDMTKDALFIVYNFLKDNIWLLLVLIVLIVAFVIASFYFKIYSRRKWIENVKASDNATQAKLIFLFALKRIKRVKKKIGRGETLLEFGERMNEELPLFNSDDVTFAELCDTYCNLIYGGKMPEDTACQKFLSYYDKFYQNLRTQMGRWKYARIFFFI
jgi:glucan phosphoethanolaminetransferase (alkaline phosphatase superfamily)